MDDIESTYLKKVQKRNEYISENIKTERNEIKLKKEQKKDHFFIED